MAHWGYFLQMDRLSLEIDRGLVARNVRMFSSPEDPEPFLTADALALAFDPRPLIRRRELEPIFEIENGMVQLRLGQGQSGARKASRAVAARNVNLRFSAAPGEVRLRTLDALFLGIQFRGRGAAYLPPPLAKPANPGSGEIPANPIPAIMHAVEHAPGWAIQISEQINAIAFASPPTADFSFAVFAANPSANSFSFRIDGAAGAKVREIDFDQFHLDAAWREQKLHVPDLRLHKGDHVLGVSGWMDAAGQIVSADLFNTLPLGTFLDLLPDDLGSPMADLFVDTRFPLRIEAKIGPVPVSEAALRLTGRIVAERLAFRGVPIERLDVAASRNGSVVSLEKGTIQFDTGPLASRLAIRDGTFRLDSRQFHAAVAGTINPHLIKPLLTPSMRNIVEWFEINEPIAGNVFVGGTAGNPAIYVHGPVAATNFAVYSVPIQSLEGFLNVTNEVMHLVGATLTRPEGSARGEVHMAFSNQTLRLDVESRLDPRATAKMLGPAIEKFMEPFRLDGPARVRVSGLLDYCNFSMNQLRARVEAERFGYDRWVADAAAFDLECVGRRMSFTNASVSAYGGSANGRGSLYPVGGDSRWRYEIDCKASSLNLADLFAASFGKPAKNLRGDLDVEGSVGGYVGKGTGPGVTGTGIAAIRNGLLFQTKLFGGLATALDKVFPDFNLFAQTDGRGSFSLRNGRIYSDNVELLGTLFGVKASGSYAFSGDLRFRVEVQPLRGGPVAAILRLAAKPVTRLLEFRLTGSFEDPKWRPVNFSPTELFD